MTLDVLSVLQPNAPVSPSEPGLLGGAEPKDESVESGFASVFAQLSPSVTPAIPGQTLAMTDALDSTAASIEAPKLGDNLNLEMIVPPWMPMAHTLPVSADVVGLKSTWLPEGRMQLITPVVPSADTGTDSLVSFAQGQGLDDAALRRLFGDEFKPEASVALKSGVLSAAAWIAGGQRQTGIHNPVVDVDAAEPVAMLDRLAMERAALGFMPTKRPDLTLPKAPSTESADQPMGMTDDGRLDLDLDLSGLFAELAPDADLKALKAEERVALALRIGEMLAQRLVAQVQRGQWQLRFALNPQNLGRVEIDMQMRGGELEATLGALNPATRELLQDALPRLREMLQQSGMDVASLNIGSGGASKNGGQPTPQAMKPSLNGPDAAGEAGQPDAPAPQVRSRGADGWDIWV